MPTKAALVLATINRMKRLDRHFDRMIDRIDDTEPTSHEHAAQLEWERLTADSVRTDIAGVLDQLTAIHVACNQLKN